MYCGANETLWDLLTITNVRGLNICNADHRSAWSQSAHPTFANSASVSHHFAHKKSQLTLAFFISTYRQSRHH